MHKKQQEKVEIKNKPTIIKATLIKKELLDSDLGCFILKISEKINYHSGQYINIRHKEHKRFRTFSITSSEQKAHEDEEIELFIRRVGEFTHLLFEASEGEEFEILRPAGHFHLEHNDKEKVFIAGGAGIAPLMSMIRTLYHEQKDDCKGILFYSARYEKELGFKEELRTIELNSDFKTILTVTREQPEFWQGETGHINKELLTKYLPQITNKEFYVCGPPPFVKAMKDNLASLGIVASNIKLEEW